MKRKGEQPTKAKRKPRAKRKPTTVPKLPTTTISPPKRNKEHILTQKRILSLYMNGQEPVEIAKSTGYALNTIRGICKEADRMVATIDPDIYLQAFVKSYNGILSAYKATNQELISQYVRLQQERDTARGLVVDSDDQSDLTLLAKQVKTLEASLVKLTSKINDNNKNYVDMIGRMGVPHSAPSTDIGSHTDSPIETFYEDMSLDADGEAESSLRRQLEYYDKENGDEK